MIGMFPDAFLNPVNHIRPIGWAFAARGLGEINYLSLYYADYDEYKEGAIDPYIFFRDAYKQNRDKKIKK
jgi:phospholipid-binding lipoprotein MlaA